MVSVHLNRFLIAAFIAAVLPTGVTAQSELFDRQVFDFEQCANQCQIELDERVFKCWPYRKDVDKEKDKPKDETCREKAVDKSEKCLNKCPANPRTLL